MGFSRQEYWSGLPFSSPGDLPNSGIEPRFPALQADTLTSEPPGKPRRSHSGTESSSPLITWLVLLATSLHPYGGVGGVLCCAKSLSWVRLFATLNCSPPGPFVRGILPARILEWVAMLFSRGSSQLRDWTCASKVSWQVGSVSLAPSRWGPKAT